MEWHANDGYNTVDEDLGRRGCGSAGNIPEGTSGGSDVRVEFDATNRGFVGKEDELSSVPVENPVGSKVHDESDINTVENLTVDNGAFDVSVPCEVHSRVTLPIPSSCSAASVVWHVPHSGFPGKTNAAVSLPTDSSRHHLPQPPPGKVTASAQLLAHRLISPIVLSPLLPPLTQTSLPQRHGEKSAHANVSLNWNYASTRDNVIHIPKERGADSKAARASSEVVDGDTEAAVEETLPFPEPEIIGGRCRVDSTSEELFRLVSKCGRRHVFSKVGLTRRWVQYARDIFTTMVDLEWKYHLVIWMASFSLTWVGFGILWWIITIFPNHAAINTDDGIDSRASNASLTTNSTIYHPSSSVSPPPVSFTCLEKVEDLTGAILFSIETQTTIGYGLRYIRSDCHPLAYILFYVQILTGVCIAFFLSGVIFRKLSRPYGRSSTILFSRNAVIRLNEPGTDYCLEFRMGDVRKSHIIGTSIRALLVKDRLTSEGERIPLCQYPLNLDTQSSVTDSFVFMPWPIIVSHRIDGDSPLWTVSRGGMREERFEIIVMFEGVVESTGASTQFRTSYLPSEVNWGHRFASLPIHERVDCDGSTPSLVDFGNFDQTLPVEMDDRCAKDFAVDRKRLLEAATTGHRKTGTTEHCKNDAEEHCKNGAAEHCKNGTAEYQKTGTTDHRKTGTAEHRVHGTAERLKPVVNQTNAEVTKIGVKDMDLPPLRIFSPEDLALRLQRRLQKRAKRRESVKPQPTNKSSILGEELAVRGQKVNKAYTF